MHNYRSHKYLSILTAILFVALLTSTLTLLATNEQLKEDLRDEALRELEIQRNSKAEQLTHLFKQIELGLQLLANDSLRVQSILVSEPQMVDSEFEPIESVLDQYLKLAKAEELFVLSADGTLLYTHDEELANRALSSDIREAELARLKELSTAAIPNRVSFTDMLPYPRKGDEPTQLATIRTADGLVMVIKIDIEAINDIFRVRETSSETQENYLVGPDYLLRSDTHLDQQQLSLLNSHANPEVGRVDTQAVRRALAGEAGTGLIFDYRGVSVLSAYAPIELGSNRWAILSESHVDCSGGDSRLFLLRALHGRAGVALFSLLCRRAAPYIQADAFY